PIAMWRRILDSPRSGFYCRKPAASHLSDCSLKKKSVYYSCFHLRLCVFSMNPTHWYAIVVLAVLLAGCWSSHREAVRGLQESDDAASDSANSPPTHLARPSPPSPENPKG